ncbi:hypothetical protein RCL1_004590 [Eukaryota sp. TZLM3-RCL]
MFSTDLFVYFTLSFYMSSKVYISNITPDTTEEHISQLCLPFGPVRNIQFPSGVDSSTHKGYCFADFEDPEDALSAVDNLHRSELLGQTLSVSFAKS